MPWDKLEDVPDSTKHHDGANLNLAQANWVAAIADNAEGADNPWAVAWAQFAKEHKKSEDGKNWVKKETDKESAIRLANEKGGSYKVMGNLKSGGTALQTFRLSKDEYTKERAKTYCDNHGGYSFAEAEGANYYRCRVRNPKDFKKGGYWTQPLKGGKPKESTSRYLERMAATDALLLSLHLTSETADGLVWVEACMALDFEDETGRHVEIARGDLNALKRNFDKQVVGRDIFVDIDHMAARAHSSDPRSRARIGVVKKMRLGVSKNEFTKGEPTLLCGVAFNKRGEEYLANDEFGYVSAVIHREWKDRRPGHQDEFAKGPVVSSITLTNDQFVPWLAPVGEDVTDRFAASRAVVIEQDTAFLTASDGKVESFALSALAGESADDLRDRLQAALHDALDLSEDEHVWPDDVQIEDETSGVVIYKHEDRRAGRAYTIADDGSISLGDAFDVRHVWEKVGEPELDEKLTRKDKQGADDMSDVETLTRQVEELKRQTKENSEELTKAQEALNTAEKTGKKTTKEVLRLKRATLLSKFERVFDALKRPNKKGRVLPVAVTNRYERLVRQALNGTPEDEEEEKITLQDTQEVAEGGTSKEMAVAVAEVAQEVAEQAETTAEAIATDANKPEEVKEAQVAGLLVEMATELEKIKELETVEPKTQAVAASRKPVGEGKSRDQLIAERQIDLLSRKQDDVPELSKFAVGTMKRSEEALRLARRQLIAENVIET